MRILLLLVALSSTSLFAQLEVPEVQRSLVTKVTATWCPPCGGWGWDLFENVLNDNATSAVLIAGHYRGSDLETVAGNDLADNFQVSGQPSFYLGNTRQSASSGSAATSRVNIKAAIDAQASLQPSANAGLVARGVQGRSYQFETETRFFQAVNGEFYLSVFAVEDDVVNRQTNRGVDAVHKRVLRGNIDGELTFGQEIVNGTVAEDQTFSTSFTFDFPQAWDIDKVRLATVLWKKNGDAYEFVNANEVESSDWTRLVSNSEELVRSEFGITGFGESGILTTTLDFSSEAQDVSLELIDASGRQLARRQLGYTPFGKTQVVWDEVNLTSGVYVVNLLIGNRFRSESVFVR